MPGTEKESPLGTELLVGFSSGKYTGTKDLAETYYLQHGYSHPVGGGTYENWWLNARHDEFAKNRIEYVRVVGKRRSADQQLEVLTAWLASNGYLETGGLGDGFFSRPVAVVA